MDEKKKYALFSLILIESVNATLAEHLEITCYAKLMK